MTSSASSRRVCPSAHRWSSAWPTACVRNKSDAEDVAQEAFVRAYRSMRGLRDRTKFKAWLVRMTWRLALDWRRAARRRDVREDAVARISPQFGDAEDDAVEQSETGASLGRDRGRCPRSCASSWFSRPSRDTRFVTWPSWSACLTARSSRGCSKHGGDCRSGCDDDRTRRAAGTRSGARRVAVAGLRGARP